MARHKVRRAEPKSLPRRSSTAATVPVVEVSQGDAAFYTLRRAIIDCDLRPGEEVSQPGLAQQFSMSLASVRFAMARIQQEGLAEPIPRTGYRIRPVSIADIHDVFRLRLMLEPKAAAMAAGKIQLRELQRLDAKCKVGFTAGNRASENAFLHANREFHMGIVKAVGSPRLTQTLERLHDEAMRMLHLTIWLRNEASVWQHGHEQILDALVRGNGAEAERIAREQLEYGRDLVLSVVLEDSSLAKLNIN